jgi:hypothetical protein
MSGVFVEVGWRRGLGTQKPRSGPESQKKGREVDVGGNAARDGGRDACAGRGARSVVVRHLKVPI